MPLLLYGLTQVRTPSQVASGGGNCSTCIYNWGNNTSNVFASDDAYASVLLVCDATPDNCSKWIETTGFGFNIPEANSTIDGIIVEVEGSSSKASGAPPANAKEYCLHIIKDGVIRSAERMNETPWNVFDAWYFSGANSDLWGEKWTPQDINAGNFGVAVSVGTINGCTPSENYFAYIDNIKITVHYSPLLPIELISFSVKTINNKSVVLEWKTASVNTNGMFTIERGINAQNFEEIGSMPGKSSSNYAEPYLFYDDQPLIGTSYYRLKVTGPDGKSGYSSIEEAIIDKPGTFDILTLYPNPARDKFSVSYQLPSDSEEPLTLLLFNMLGQNVYKRILGKKSSGIHKESVLVNDIRAGIYFVRIKMGNEERMKKIRIEE